MAKKTKRNSKRIRQKLPNYKTPAAKALPKITESELTLPPEPEIHPEPEEKSRKSWLKSIFGRKGESQESAKVPESRINYPATSSLQEPDFLMDIDMGRHPKEVEPELALWLNDGRIVKSLEELAKALRTMKGRAFSQHQENNEIRDWVNDVTGNAQLAAEMAAAKTKNDAIKALENHLKENSKKKKAEPAEKLEIQRAIEEIRKKPESDEKSSTLEEREKLLEGKERQLETEEDVINNKRIALANRRYQLIKERGELEKEKFEKILKQHGRKTGMEAARAGMPETELTHAYTIESIRQLIIQARADLESGDMASAKKAIAELKNALDSAAIEPEEIKRLEYDVLELEADLKLALLA